MKLYRQIILLTLALLVLVSSTGMAVGVHLCGGELRDVTLFGASSDCPMRQVLQEPQPPCHTPKQAKPDNDGCCQDHKTVAERHDSATDTQSSIDLHKLQHIKLLAIVKAVVLQFYASESTLAPRYTAYTSPPFARDIPLLVQSFLL
ncbi:hypothetical protein MKJ04_18085 [Pontibacter sp. E15-1]|uniref:HYC_CC_PP family protein n=1 Tax=Pontibacter sp. E15-1 TaxID=2919918 RepID=UPI001F4F4E3C|nr:hypothetical protein [Pontibacter sp. E15-1]MCJ8166762.1 hypothetical protein [Pontibacter sp. E15-1]